ncbi:MAG: DUF2834 domain-containing protein [Myxococcales bacterium]|nr:DUF2834 domain-containing protein [Myxococcales bacterium]
MNKKQILLTIVLVDFLALTAWAVAEVGFVQIFAGLLDNPGSVQVGVDLLLAIGMIAAWMWVDARKHGLTVAPYLLLTATLGSIGPLVYLIRRESLLKR